MIAIRRLGMVAGVSAIALALTACGGGGGGGVAPIPSPTPSPTPTPTPTPPPPPITIFGSPSPGEYGVVGASIAGPGGNLDTYSSASDRFGAVSGADQDQAHIRYTSGGFYEVEMPGQQWDRLVPYKGDSNPPPDEDYFQPDGVPMNYAYLVISRSRLLGYDYSELADWGSAAAGRRGFVAFGTLTPTGAVPVTGSASYSGIAAGSADVLSADYLYGGYVPAYLTGSVQLDFDFSKGALGGALNLSFDDGTTKTPLGTFAFKDTVFSAGSTSYSGRFDTNATSGSNFFAGRFTGPHAAETIGAWALPFVYSSGPAGMPPDNQTHQAFGAWIAKNH